MECANLTGNACLWWDHVHGEAKKGKEKIKAQDKMATKLEGKSLFVT